MRNNHKVGIVGVGMVGSTIAYTLAMSGLYKEMVLVDYVKEKAEGEAMDISHGLLYAYPMTIMAGDYKDLKDCGLVIVTAGLAQKPGETRLDLVKKNTELFKTMIPAIMQSGFNGNLLIVSNPVDILTRVALKLSGLPKNQVFGSGTVLDTARLKYLLGQHLGLDPKSIHAFILGEHGDSEIVSWSNSNVAGVPLNQICEMKGYYNHQASMEAIAESVRNAANEIILRKKATYYGIGMAVKRICEVIQRDEKSILPLSTHLHGELGLADVTLSVPAILGANGVEKILPYVLSPDENQKLSASAKLLKETYLSLAL
jgi:L-lactate dehydrogenase